jgi:hypothetical protein
MSISKQNPLIPFMAFTRLLPRRAIRDGSLTHYQGIQSRVFVFGAHFIGEFNGRAFQHGIEFHKFKLGRLVCGDGSHLLERRFGLFLISAGDGYICAELGEVNGDFKSVFGGELGSRLPEPMP